MRAPALTFHFNNTFFNFYFLIFTFKMRAPALTFHFNDTFFNFYFLIFTF